MIIRLAAVLLAASVLATPASAQFGGLKKKLKNAAGQEDAKSAPAATDPAGEGGVLVLTPEVVNRLIAGLEAGRAEREIASKEDTPYARYQRAQQAYEVAKPTCEAAQQTFIQRMSGDEKMLQKYNRYTEKMVAAQSKQDYSTMQIYQDSAMGMQDPSCLVKKPEQPRDFYEAQRAVDVRADQAAAAASDLGAGGFALAQERAMMILRGGMPGDVSQAEKAAVTTRKADLEPLLWPTKEPAPPTTNPAATAAPAPMPAPAPDPKASAAASDMSACMTRNVQTHQAQIQALGKRAEAAQKAGDQARMMAIADTLQQLQMAGCTGG